ncbi:CLUMA_CG012347, isoform A [Clunio marinus]|uniref:CLUMA_CG012347, isoform A n=1 Tax=Clunio marinus TaxID=568069 RepID=A0A1J1IIR7_9DIPT|nr:CLUMA_CG012347, isoform A [Clunio marinus]
MLKLCHHSHYNTSPCLKFEVCDRVNETDQEILDIGFSFGCEQSIIMMSLHLWRISIIAITLMIDFSCEKHLGFYFSDFNFTFNPKYMNISVDMSIYKTNTKRHPVYLVPETTIEIFEDIPKLHIVLIAKDLKTGKILADRTVDFCDISKLINSNAVFHSLMHHLLDTLKFALKCPFKQGIYKVKEHHMPNYIVPGLMHLHDRYLNIQKIRTRLDEHITTIFESSYVTEVCEFDN